MSQRRKAQQPPAAARRGRPRQLMGELLERPLTARSLIASLLLGMHPPRLSSARLVRWCELFGVSEGTARVALSRMVERGELEASDGVYELAGPVRARQEVQDWLLDATPLAPDGWNGTWLLAVVTAEERPAGDRAAFRAAAAAVRLGEVREGLWVRPANLPRSAAPSEAWRVVDAQCAWWAGAPPGDGRPLAERLFHTQAWAERARLLTARLTDVTEALAASPDTPLAHEALAEGFVAGAACLQHLRRDALLPADLVGPGWPAGDLRTVYRRYQDVYPAAAASFLR